MKRSRLERRTPLTAKTELRRKSALGHSPLARSALHADSAARKAAPKRASTTSIPAKVRAALKVRSGGLCEIAAPGCAEIATDDSHRIKSGMGGRKGAAAVRHHVLSNLMHACRHCHSKWLHASPAAAYAAGWMLREHQNPLTEPVVYRGTWCLLGDDGSIRFVDLSEEQSMTVTRFRKKPVEVSALQWDGENVEEVRDFTEGRFDALDELDRKNCDDPEATAQVFDVLHSTWVLVQTGDWIIKGIQGEFYPCRSDVFDATYDRAA